MSEESTALHFIADPFRFLPAATHVGRVPAGISGKAQLMRALEAALRLPGYFGRNWDALSDCLRDLSWLAPGRVALVHDALPDLSQDELRTYLEVLVTAVRDWKPRERYELQVFLPEQDKERVLTILTR